MKLLQVDTLEEARQKLLTIFGGHALKKECVPLERTFGLILAEDVRSKEQIPSFPRSSVDGYAVCFKDTAGATESIPVFLEIVEEVEIGHPARKRITPGTCAYVPTGGMIPEGADAMVMVEYSELLDENHVAVYEPVPFGKSVVSAGEDVESGQLLLARGASIGPAQVGALAAAGFNTVPVYAPWKVAILSTGDELVSVEERPEPGQVRDINTWALQAYAAASKMLVVKSEVIKDDEKLIEQAVRDAMKCCDLVLISGGSSQGKKDRTKEIFDRVSGGGVFTHGLALKPGKPTILGYDEKTDVLLVGLPGHPVAALTVYQLLIVWLYKFMTGQKEEMMTLAKMGTNLASAPGKTTCLLVRLIRKADGYTAEPILGKSGLITTMAEADGYVMVDMNREGLSKGETVPVYRFM